MIDFLSARIEPAKQNTKIGERYQAVIPGLISREISGKTRNAMLVTCLFALGVKDKVNEIKKR